MRWRTLRDRTEMMLDLRKLSATLDAWRRYRRTRAELARLPLDVALDLDIYPGDARAIARRAVWGTATR